MCGRDRVTGIGVEHMDDAIEVMNDAQQPCQHLLSTSSAAEPHQRKRNRKDPLVEVVTNISSSLTEYCSSLLIVKNFRIIF